MGRIVDAMRHTRIDSTTTKVKDVAMVPWGVRKKEGENKCYHLHSFYLGILREWVEKVVEINELLKV